MGASLLALAKSIYYLVSLQYNFTISDHSEPVVAHGVMADRLFSAQSVWKISLTCILQIA